MKDGDKARCKMCGEAIEYVEPTFGNALWTHVPEASWHELGPPLHPATPKDSEEQLTMQQLQIYYDAIPILVDFLRRLSAVEIDRPDIEAYAVLQKFDVARAKAHEK